MNVKSRPIYVPAAHRKIAKEARPRAPEAIATLAASLVFRLVAWAGASAVVERLVPLTLAPKPDPVAVARTFFADIPWSGARPVAPSGAALRSSVKSILDNFRWGD